MNYICQTQRSVVCAELQDPLEAPAAGCQAGEIMRAGAASSPREQGRGIGVSIGYHNSNVGNY